MSNFALKDLATKHGANATDIGNTLPLYQELAVQFAKYGDEAAIAEVQALFKEELKSKLQFQASSSALTSLIESMDAGRINDTMAANIGEMYTDRMKELKAKGERGLDKGSEMQEFKKAIWQAAHPDEPFFEGGDDDLAVMAPADDNIICPLTRKEFVDPVKNVCGHTYSREALLTYLGRGRGPRGCPVAGCNQNVSVGTVKPDEQMQRKLANSKKRKRMNEDEEDVENL